MGAGKCDEVFPFVVFEIEWLISSMAEEVGLLPAKFEGAVHGPELDAAVVDVAGDLLYDRHCAMGGCLVLHFVEVAASEGVVDGPAIVGIDEAEVPEVGALIKVGDAGRADFEDELRE